MTQYRVGTRDEWQAARKELLERENELANLSKELARQRRERTTTRRRFKWERSS